MGAVRRDNANAWSPLGGQSPKTELLLSWRLRQLRNYRVRERLFLSYSLASDMTNLNYTPDKDLKVHPVGAIRLICQAFQSHDTGLPEWVKNASDEYERVSTKTEDRVIVLFFSNTRRLIPSAIGCLDFCGMTSRVIESAFRQWADPEASHSEVSEDIQGGHGNGGKCYMTQMFDRYAYLHTVKNKKGNQYGVQAGSVNFGYIPTKEKGRDYSVSDLNEELRVALKTVQCKVENLPVEALRVLKKATGFTLVAGIGPRNYGDKIPVSAVMKNLLDNPQMIKSLHLATVYVVVNGTVANGGQPFRLEAIKALAGGEEPRVIPIPEILNDKARNQDVSTTEAGRLAQGKLTLFTSETSMRWSRKFRHTITYRANGRYIGYVDVMSLGVQSAFAAHIYGECELDSLESYKQNARSALAEGPLRDAIEGFLEEQVEIYAREFEARERRIINQRERSDLSNINQALDEWKNKFLKQKLSTITGPGGEDQTRTQLPSGRPSRMELFVTHVYAGIGVSIRPTLQFYDKSGKRIRPVPFRWVSDDTNVAMVDEDLNVINTYSPGVTRIQAELLDGTTKSNPVSLTVVKIKSITIAPTEVTISVGSKTKLEAVCEFVDGTLTSEIYLIWSESNSDLVKASPSGMLYGVNAGVTEVMAHDDTTSSANNAIITVIPADERDRGRHGFPRVLLSEYDRDPDTNQDVKFSSDEPPVTRLPIDVERNVWWINTAAPLARLYLDASRGFGYKTREWRIYHLERFVDVIVQIALENGPSDKERMTADDWIRNWGVEVSAIQASAAVTLLAFLSDGELPS
jgi:hypothetical protein